MVEMSSEFKHINKRQLRASLRLITYYFIGGLRFVKRGREEFKGIEVLRYAINGRYLID